MEGFIKEEGKWYFYKDGKKIKSQWVMDKNSKWYYIGKDCVMVTGWFQTHKNGDTWFFAFDKTTDNQGKRFYAGEIVTGWLKYNNQWYFLEPSNTDTLGSMYCDGVYKIDNKEYTFNKNGQLEDNNLVSNKCIKFIKEMEGFYARKYDDGCGVITQGYGCTGNEIISWNDTVSEEVASEKLVTLLDNIYAPPIKKALQEKGIILKQNEFDALVSMAYNIGVQGLLRSTLFNNICKGVRNPVIITNNFLTWSLGDLNGDGTLDTIEGLLRRRRLEANIFLNGQYSTN